MASLVAPEKLTVGHRSPQLLQSPHIPARSGFSPQRLSLFLSHLLIGMSCPVCFIPFYRSFGFDLLTVIQKMLLCV